MDGLPSLAVAALALWRVSAWLTFDEKAEGIRARLCRWPFAARQIDCFWCVSLWLSLPIVLAWWLWWPMLLPLALSGAAILLSHGGRIVYTEMKDDG